MNRAQKQAFVDDFTKCVTDAESFALMSFTGIKVETMTSFRLALRKQDVRVRVLKNTLARRVFEQTPFKALIGELKGPILLAYGGKDPVLSAKVLWEWAGKKEFNAEVKSGVAFGKILSTEELKQLSQLPGREQLLISFLWALKSGPTKFLYALQDAPKRVGYALVALKKKKEQESS